MNAIDKEKVQSIIDVVIKNIAYLEKDSEEKLPEVSEILHGVRLILEVPEGESIIIHAKKIMDKLKNRGK